MDLNAEADTTSSERFDGTVALVTGAGRGIGREIAVALAQAGAAVALVARSKEELEQTAELVREPGGTALVVAADLAVADQVASIARRVRDELGAPGILVNNAGVAAPLGPSATIDPAAFATAMTVNVVAVATLTFALLPAMTERGWGRIANISTGIVARPEGMIGGNAYVTSKTALEAHTVNLAAELAGTGVTVNAYRPGAVDTAMQAFLRSQEQELEGTEVHERFTRWHADRTLITPQASARSLVARLHGEQTGAIWNVSDPI